jgi:hypothetical protein
MTICFISHASEDRHFVEGELLGLLEALGVTPWYSRQHITAAEEWEQRIRKALEVSTWFVVVASRNSAASPWVRHELHWAMTNLRGRVIPVLLEDTPLDDLHVQLKSVQLIDFRDSKDKGRNAVIRLLRHHGGRQVTLEGEWRGVANQPLSAYGPVQMEAKLSFMFVGSVLRGTFGVAFPTPDGPIPMDFDAACDMFYDRFIQLNYRSRDPSMVQFGAIVLDIDDMGKTVRGSYVGYGALSQMIVSGTVQLNKVGV